MTPTQQELIPVYHLRYETESTLTLQPVADYVLVRYGRSGRVYFQGRGLNLTLSKDERERFLRFLRRRQLLKNVTRDDGRRNAAAV